LWRWFDRGCWSRDRGHFEFADGPQHPPATLAEVRCDWSREKEVIRGQSRDLTIELEVRIARLEGKVEALMALLQGRGQVVDLPPLPKIEASTERTLVTKVKVTE
jgi:hypothetical protein